LAVADDCVLELSSAIEDELRWPRRDAVRVPWKRSRSFEPLAANSN
jgi:hypothetical protein